MKSAEMNGEIGTNTGSWNGHDAIFLSFEEVSGTVLRSTKEYTLAYIPELDIWRGDVITYGQSVVAYQGEIADLRLGYCLDDLVRAN